MLGMFSIFLIVITKTCLQDDGILSLRMDCLMEYFCCQTLVLLELGVTVDIVLLILIALIFAAMLQAVTEV